MDAQDRKAKYAQLAGMYLYFTVYIAKYTPEVRAARANKIREQWITVMQSRLLREELSKCQRSEGVNSYENCKAFAERYIDSLKNAKVCFHSHISSSFQHYISLGNWLADNRCRVDSVALVV